MSAVARLSGVRGIAAAAQVLDRATSPGTSSTAAQVRRPRLRVLPTPRRRAPRAPFIVLVIAILVGGLAAVLVLNTQRAQDAFTLTSLKKTNAQLRDQVQTLQGQVQQDTTPSTIASRAADLGMQPGGDPIFVDPTGKILGIGASGSIALSTGKRMGDIVVIGQAKPKPVTTPTASAAATSPASTSPPTPSVSVAPSAAAPAAGASPTTTVRP